MADTTIYVRDIELIEVRVPERGQPGAGAILKINGESVDASKSLNLVNPGLISSGTGGDLDVTIPYSGVFRGDWDMSIVDGDGNAVIPDGSLDLDSFYVSVGGAFHGKTTQQGQTVQLIRSKTDLTIIPTVNDQPPIPTYIQRTQPTDTGPYQWWELNSDNFLKTLWINVP
jgi:hypothetical protein